MSFLNSYKVCLFRGEICIVKFNTLGSEVTFDGENKLLTFEVGPISEFEVIGDFYD